MRRKFPDQVLLDAQEVQRANRLYVAKWLGISPLDVDRLPQSDVDDALELMWLESQK